MSTWQAESPGGLDVPLVSFPEAGAVHSLGNGDVYLVIGIKVHADAIFGAQLDIRDALLVRQAQFKLLHSRCVRLHDGCNGSLALVFILPATCEEKGGTAGESSIRACTMERFLLN